MTTDSTTQNGRVLKGTVVSTKMKDTITVAVERYVMHPKYKKFIKRHKRYKVHDGKNEFKVGDKVRIEACSPVSRHKAFVAVEKLGTQDVSQYLRTRGME